MMCSNEHSAAVISEAVGKQVICAVEVMGWKKAE
jgi:hypothetical protein